MNEQDPFKKDDAGSPRANESQLSHFHLNPILPRWTPTELALAEAKLHREKVMRVVGMTILANNIKNLDLEIQFCPEEVPVIKVMKGGEDEDVRS